MDGAEEWGEEVGEVGEAVGGEVREIWESGERVGERGGSGGGGDGEEGGEVGAVGLGDGVVQAGEVVGDAAVSLAHAQVRRHLRRGGGGGGGEGVGVWGSEVSDGTVVEETGGMGSIRWGSSGFSVRW